MLFLAFPPGSVYELWRLRTTSEFSMNVTFRSWASKQMSTATTAESDKVHNVSLPQMMI